MRVYAEVKVLASSKNSFTSKEGEYVEYYENVLKSDSGLMTLNSKADYLACEGKEGVAEIEAAEKDDGKGFKLTLKGFIADAKIPAIEEEID